MTPLEPDTPAVATEGTVHPHVERSEDQERSYLDLIRSIHDEWDELEAAEDMSVTASPRVLEAVMTAVRSEVNRGVQVEVPPTDLGPYTVSEASLRSLVRHAVDSVTGAEALRSSFDHAPASDHHRGLGEPSAIHCRVSAHTSVSDLVAFAEQVRRSVRDTCVENLGIEPTINVHVEDLHDEQ